MNAWTSVLAAVGFTFIQLQFILSCLIVLLVSLSDCQ